MNKLKETFCTCAGILWHEESRLEKKKCEKVLSKLKCNSLKREELLKEQTKCKINKVH